jgi:hypothetical protein
LLVSRMADLYRGLQSVLFRHEQNALVITTSEWNLN